jgi:photosystem II stability/assembly factor-like uncharacterized protein
MGSSGTSGGGPGDTVQISLNRATAETLMHLLAEGLGQSAVLNAPGGVSRWRVTNAPVASSRTDDIWFVDGTTGWLVNSNGQVCHTSDGGDSWTEQTLIRPTSPGRPYLRTIQFATARVGWFGALCSDARRYRETLLHQTRDGGATWRAVANLPDGSPQGICGLAVVNEEVAYGAGSNDPSQLGPAILKTTNGGRTWTAIDMKDHADNLVDIHFFDASRGFVVGGRNHDFCPGAQPWYAGHPQYARLKPVVLYTEDGGRTWVDRVATLKPAFDCGSWGWKLFWLDARRGFVSIEDFNAGAILKTDDGGENWVLLPINDRRILGDGKDGKKGKKGDKGKDKSRKVVSNANLEGIGFLDGQTGWVGGWGDAEFIGDYNSQTTDGGRNWAAQDHDPDDPASDVRVNVNRYRFLGDPVHVGYCSGKTVYKLVVDDDGGKGGDGKSDGGKRDGGKADGGKSDDRRTEGKSGRVRAVRAGVVAETPEPAPLDLTCTPGAARGSVEIALDIPAGTRTVYIGIWSHFGWYVRTLLDERTPAPGRRTVVWDGRDDEGRQRTAGMFICRVVCDDRSRSENIHIL